MGRVLSIHAHLAYPECPHCGSVTSRIVPVDDPRPNVLYLYCDDCHEVWTIRVGPFSSPQRWINSRSISMGRATSRAFDPPEPPCPHCGSVDVRPFPGAEGKPDVVHVLCDECSEVWTVPVLPVGGRLS